MTSAAILTTLMTLSVHWGWQPATGGGIEYIIRIDPYSVSSLREGHDVFSDLPPSFPPIRSYRITVSDKPVPHEGEPPPKPQSVSVARPPAEVTIQPSLTADLPATSAVPDAPATSHSSRLFPNPMKADSASSAVVNSPRGPTAGTTSSRSEDAEALAYTPASPPAWLLPAFYVVTAVCGFAVVIALVLWSEWRAVRRTNRDLLARFTPAP